MEIQSHRRWGKEVRGLRLEAGRPEIGKLKWLLIFRPSLEGLNSVNFAMRLLVPGGDKFNSR
jgi:hypothetical protein